MKERYAMNENKVIYSERKTKSMIPLAEILRTGARRLITRAVEVEIFARPDGRQRVVRHGHDPVRTIQSRDQLDQSAKAEGSRSWRTGGLRAHSLSHHQSYENGRGDKRPTSQGRG